MMQLVDVAESVQKAGDTAKGAKAPKKSKKAGDEAAAAAPKQRKAKAAA